ncbi:MAG: TonB-dependent receptor [Thermoanaerobaculia bacterium]|nr:TonB-dependent receptor [Thermoanaerobaculia bacterium]
MAFALLATLSLGSSVWAQQESAATEEAGQEQTAKKESDEQVAGTIREEVTVTARKQGTETLTEVPFSIAAPTEQVLRERGAQNLEDVSVNVAGFSIQNLGPSQSQIAMRGVSAGQIVRDQPGVKEQVGVYLDESVISLSLFTPDIDLFDMSRVEVLRGPQGTLFGSGSLSGTVRYITNQPALGVSDSVAELSFSSIDGGSLGGSAKIATNVPIGDKAALRVTAYYNSLGGFIDAVQPGLSIDHDVNDGERYGGRLAFRFTPSDRLTITPRVIFQKVDMNGWNRADAYNILGNPFTTTRPAMNLGEREQFTQFEEPFTDDFLLADVTVEVDLGDVKLTSITSYTDRDILVVRDATALTASITGGSIGLPEPIYSLDAPLNDATTAKVLTQELRFSGNNGRLGWVAGAFYSTIERDYAQRLVVNGFQNLSGIPTQGLLAPRDVLFYSDLAYDFDQLAVFGEGTWAVNDKLDITAGLRWYDYQEDRDQVFDGIFGNDNNGTSLVSTPGSTEADGIVPRLIASYEATENTRVNAQVSRGFRLGGINDPLNVPLCTPQDLVTFGGRDSWNDEKLWNYEIGSKTTLGGGSGSFSTAAFYMDIDDLQATVTAGSCSSRVVFNVPKARSTGVELELALQPTPLFDFAISASYTDSELRSTLTSTDAAGNVSVVAGIQEGNRLPTVPEFQAAAAATWRKELADNKLGYVSGTFQYVGSRFTQIGDQAAGFGTVNLLSFAPNTIGGPLTGNTFRFNPELPSYNLVNLRFGVLTGPWDIALFVNNVTDEVALLALDQERGTRARVGYLTNQPRTFGLSARVSF